MESTGRWSNPDTGNIVSFVSLLVIWCGAMVSIGGFVMISSDYPNDSTLVVVGPILVVGGALITISGIIVCVFVVRPACCYRGRAEKRKEELFSTAVSSPSTEYITTEFGSAATPTEAPPLSSISSAYPPGGSSTSGPPNMSYVPVSEISTVGTGGYTSTTVPREQKDSADYTMPTHWK